MIGHTSLRSDSASHHLQVETDETASSQHVAPEFSIRFLWTGLGFAVLMLLGVSAHSLPLLAPRTSAKPSRLAPQVASFVPDMSPLLGAQPDQQQPLAVPGVGAMATERSSLSKFEKAQSVGPAMAPAFGEVTDSGAASLAEKWTWTRSRAFDPEQALALLLQATSSAIALVHRRIRAAGNTPSDHATALSEELAGASVEDADLTPSAAGWLETLAKHGAVDERNMLTKGTLAGLASLVLFGTPAEAKGGGGRGGGGGGRGGGGRGRSMGRSGGGGRSMGRSGGGGRSAGRSVGGSRSGGGGRSTGRSGGGFRVTAKARPSGGLRQASQSARQPRSAQAAKLKDKAPKEAKAGEAKSAKAAPPPKQANAATAPTSDRRSGGRVGGRAPSAQIQQPLPTSSDRRRRSSAGPTNIYVQRSGGYGFGYGRGYGGGFGYGYGYDDDYLGLSLVERLLREDQRRAYMQQQLKAEQELGQDQAQIQALGEQLRQQDAKIKGLKTDSERDQAKEALLKRQETELKATNSELLKLKAVISDQQKEIERLKAFKPPVPVAVPVSR